MIIVYENGVEDSLTDSVSTTEESSGEDDDQGKSVDMRRNESEEIEMVLIIFVILSGDTLYEDRTETAKGFSIESHVPTGNPVDRLGLFVP